MAIPNIKINNSLQEIWERHCRLIYAVLSSDEALDDETMGEIILYIFDRWGNIDCSNLLEELRDQNSSLTRKMRDTTQNANRFHEALATQVHGEFKEQ